VTKANLYNITKARKTNNNSNVKIT